MCSLIRTGGSAGQGCPMTSCLEKSPAPAAFSPPQSLTMLVLFSFSSCPRQLWIRSASVSRFCLWLSRSLLYSLLSQPFFSCCHITLSAKCTKYDIKMTSEVQPLLTQNSIMWRMQFFCCFFLYFGVGGLEVVIFVVSYQQSKNTESFPLTLYNFMKCILMI